MDVLEDIFNALALQGAFYFRTDFSAPWAVAVPVYEQAARFHLVVQGRCHVRLASGSTADLGPGDLILIPGGQAHELADAPGHHVPPLETVLRDAGYRGNHILAVGEGDPAASTQMICGHLSFRQGADHPILRAMPDHIVVSAADRAKEAWVDETLRLLTRRIFQDAASSAPVVRRLSEVIFVELLRLGIGADERLATVLSGLHHPQIGKALELIHSRPGDPWTVASLASEVGMSRTRFADQFSQIFGHGPMHYLSDWRLQKALSALTESQVPVQQVAAQCGYRSPAAFTRAFADKFGVAPTQMRRRSA